MGIAVEQPGEQVGLEFVLTGLAGQDDDDGEAAVIEDGVFDGTGDLDLVWAQDYLAGMRPGDGTAANGGADGKRKGRGVRGHFRSRSPAEKLAFFGVWYYTPRKAKLGVRYAW
jgi:hypothetical protein